MNTARAETENAFERLRADNEKLRADFASRFDSLSKEFSDKAAARATRETWLVVFLVATVIGVGWFQ